MFDHVIVGAGSAGCVLANRLTEDPATKVLLVEAGPSDKPREIHVPAAFSKVLRTERDWAYETAPQPNLDGRRIYWPRGKTLGGSSSINAMIYMRGNAADYDEWAKRGNPEWSYDGVLAFFKKAEDNSRGASAYHGAGGPLPVSDLRDPNPLTIALLEAAVEAGISRNDDFNGAAQDGAGLVQVTQRKGRRASTAVSYLRPALDRPNLTVETGAHTTKIVVENRRARAIEYVQQGREHTASASREVVLCGGAVNSPQILMLSGIGPVSHLAEVGVDPVAHLPGVGRNLEDHVCIATMCAVTEPLSLYTAEKVGELVRFLVLGKGKLTSNIGEACAFVRTSQELDAPDIQIHFAPVYFDTNLLEEPTEHAVTAGPVLLTPRSAGHVELASADPLQDPVIEPNYLGDPDGEDLRRLVAGVKVCRNIYRQPAFDRFRGSELQPGAHCVSDNDLADFVRARASTLYHPTGTCRMGTDDFAVVDPELRVHGIEGLRVVDASVMPRIVRGNTNAPTIMIAEKAATLIRSEI